MVWFWSSSGKGLAIQVEALRAAENRLVEYASRFMAGHHHAGSSGNSNGAATIQQHDTYIPRSVVPVQKHDDQVYDNLADLSRRPDDYLMHGLHVQNPASSTPNTTPPLVLLHGYMNGAAYFYRNLFGLSIVFSNVYALDLLGWGLSSRPTFDLTENTTGGAEQFFVNSLEAWRQRNHIDRMVLAGHSMGGYLSVAYCEQYPQHVERLVLLSPVGVPHETPEHLTRRQARIQASLPGRVLGPVYERMFTASTFGNVLRVLPASGARSWFVNYVERRLPAIGQVDERDAVAGYLFANSALPGSGEHCVNRILNPFAFAKAPLVDRIAHLHIPSVTFLYGDVDWMDPQGGLQVQERCKATAGAPLVKVYTISQAGHLLMLENWQEFNAGLALAMDRDDVAPTASVRPKLLTLADLTNAASANNSTASNAVQVQAN